VTSWLLRIALALPVLAAGLGATSSVARVGPTATLCAQAASVHRVGVVVEHADGRVIRRCVGFGTATDTALAALQASGLEVGISSYGGGLGDAVCQIDNEPATYPPGCFTATSPYWVLFVSRAGAAWVVSNLGASNVTLVSGDDIGFRYDSQTGSDPPPPSPAGACPTVTPSPARTPAPTAGATRSPRATSAAAAPTTPLSVSRPPAKTPASGVLGLATPGPGSAPVGALTSTRAQAGVNVGLLLAAVGAGGLVGLLGARSLRRRRQ
jgi:hypothetical protein